MTYKEVLKELHNSEPQPNPNYWRIIFKHSKIIVTEVALSNQHKVSKELGFSQSKLSQLMPILKEFSNDY